MIKVYSPLSDVDVTPPDWDSEAVRQLKSVIADYVKQDEEEYRKNLAEEFLREEHPVSKDLWEQYNTMLHLVKEK